MCYFYCFGCWFFWVYFRGFRGEVEVKFCLWVEFDVGGGLYMDLLGFGR